MAVHRAISDFTNTRDFGDADGSQALITRDCPNRLKYDLGSPLLEFCAQRALVWRSYIILCNLGQLSS
jgi:hypothetical protein